MATGTVSIGTFPSGTTAEAGPQPLGQHEGAGMSPPRAEAAAFGSAKWWGQFAKSGSTIRTGIFAIIVSIGYGLSAFCSWLSRDVITPYMEGSRDTQKHVIAQSLELTALVKSLQQDMAKRDIESARVATELTRTNAIMIEQDRKRTEREAAEQEERRELMQGMRSLISTQSKMFEFLTDKRGT